MEIVLDRLNYLSLNNQPMIKQHFLFAIVILAFSFQNMTAQDAGLTISSGKKEKTLKTDGAQFLEFSFNITGDSLNCGTQSFSGKILSLNEQLISFQPETESLNITRLDGTVMQSKTKYPAGAATVVLPAGAIGMVRYQSEAARNWYNLGGTMTVVGGITSLILAPLMSIEYGAGGFNEDRFFRWSGAGLASVSLGVPMMILTKKKKYYLKGGTHGKRIWAISH